MVCAAQTVSEQVWPPQRIRHIFASGIVRYKMDQSPCMETEIGELSCKVCEITFAIVFGMSTLHTNLRRMGSDMT